MKFKYSLDKKEMKEVFYLYQSRNNLFFMIFFILLYTYLIYTILKQNILFGLLSIFIYSIILYLFLLITNHLTASLFCKLNEKKLKDPYGNFEGSISKSGIYEKSEKVIRDLNWNNIIKLKKYRHFYVVFTDQKIMLMFRKKYFVKENDYEKSIELIKKQIKEK